jgi:Fe-S-cluster containining protein
MPIDSEIPANLVTLQASLSSTDWRLRVKLTVPKGPTPLRHLLPLVQSLTDAVVDSATRAVEEGGAKVSCKKGCGACCRQLVPISEVEARHIHDLVEQLPEPRRSVVRTRFAEARQRLEAAGLLDMLQHPERLPEGEGRALGLKYFAQGIPCPFLEEESCSIHPDRPVACREYLVTSPAEHCALPSAETVRCVPLPLKVSNALQRLAAVEPGARSVRWVPLVLAPEWAETHPDDSSPRPGPEWLRELFDQMTSKKRE